MYENFYNAKFSRFIKLMYQTARFNEQVVVPKFGLPNVHYDQAH